MDKAYLNFDPILGGGRDQDKQEEMDKIGPRSIDDIIRAERDKYSLIISTLEEHDELLSIVKTMADQIPIRARLNGWHFICVKKDEAKWYVLVGFHEAQDCVWATSVIAALDLACGLAMANSNNIYQLGTK